MTSSPSTSEFTRDDPFIKNIFPQSTNKFHFKNNLSLGGKYLNNINDSNNLSNDKNQAPNILKKNLLEEVNTKRPITNLNRGASVPRKVEIKQNNNLNKIILDNCLEKDPKKARMLSVESKVLSPNYHNSNLKKKNYLIKIKKVN